MNVEKKEHPQYSNLSDHLGKWQYIYSKKDVKISLIELKDELYKNAPWEIYQLEGKQLFEDVERFQTKEEAVQRIKELLK